MVTVETLEGLLKQHGWYLNMIRRYKTRYAYAQRRLKGTVVSRYLKTERLLHELSEEEVLKRIAL